MNMYTNNNNINVSLEEDSRFHLTSLATGLYSTMHSAESVSPKTLFYIKLGPSNQRQPEKTSGHATKAPQQIMCDYARQATSSTPRQRPNPFPVFPI